MTLHPNLTREDFHTLVTLGDAIVDGIYGAQALPSALAMSRRFNRWGAGPDSISWIPRVRFADKLAFEAAAQAEAPGFKVYPPTVEEEYMVVYLIEPVPRGPLLPRQGGGLIQIGFCWSHPAIL